MEQVPSIIGDVVALALGACVGSFAVTVAYRLPRDISIAAPRSFCENCERPIPWWANIPVFSYLASRGRCVMCGASIRVRHPAGELALALAALLTHWAFFFRRSGERRPFTAAWSLSAHLLLGAVLMATSIALGSPGVIDRLGESGLAFLAGLLFYVGVFWSVMAILISLSPPSPAQPDKGTLGQTTGG